ncbi:hypothetical protein GCM10016455_30820 [Aliiroseovarius zhejiangensis]|uniref:Uncharacterized protein n=1 Tax=Aliiroseovarius zhejiangensis TaxID=1632025 RepID=A0ABQ3J9Y4_9RHOB|nr:hypothetical protein GCM10016455_30820 [Aliiroseovarius zhejiangensis]
MLSSDQTAEWLPPMTVQEVVRIPRGIRQLETGVQTHFGCEETQLEEAIWVLGVACKATPDPGWAFWSVAFLGALPH